MKSKYNKKEKYDFDQLYICCTVCGRGITAKACDYECVLILDGDKLIDVRNYDNKGNPDPVRTFVLSQIFSTKENGQSSIPRQ